MPEYRDEKTVVVDRDAATPTRESPVGMIVLLVALLLIALFLLMGGYQMLTGDSTTDEVNAPSTSDTIDNPITTPEADQGAVESGPTETTPTEPTP